MAHHSLLHPAGRNLLSLRRLLGELSTLLWRSGLSLWKCTLGELHGLLALRRVSLCRWTRLLELALWLLLWLLLGRSLCRLLAGWLALWLFTGLSWVLVWILAHRSYCVGSSVVRSCAVRSLVCRPDRLAVAFSECCGGCLRSVICWPRAGEVRVCSCWTGCWDHCSF